MWMFLLLSIIIKWARHWWHMPLITALGRQRQTDFWVQSQPGLHSELQDSKGYIEKSVLEIETCLEKKKKKYQMSILSLPLSFQGHLKICFITICVCVFVFFVHASAHVCMHVLWYIEVRGQLSGVGSLLLPCEFWDGTLGVKFVQQVSLSLGILTGFTGPFIFLRQNIETLSRERRPSLRVLVWQPWEAAVHVIQLNQWMVPAQDHSLPHITGPT